MFIATLFIIAKIWKHPTYSSTYEWIKNVMYTCIYIYIYVYTHTVEYYSATKKIENFAICSNMEELGGYCAK